MSGDTREVLIQLTVSAFAAALVAIGLLCMRRGARTTAPLWSGAAIAAAIVLVGVVEARVLAALAAGAAIGAVVAGILTLAPSVGAVSRATVLRRMLHLATTTAVALLPLAALDKRSSGDSMLRLTRSAAEGSDGNWVAAWQRSWQLLLDPDRAQLRVSLTAAWLLLLGLAFVAVAFLSSRVLRWRLGDAGAVTGAVPGGRGHASWSTPKVRVTPVRSASIPDPADWADAASGSITVPPAKATSVEV